MEARQSPHGTPKGTLAPVSCRTLPGPFSVVVVPHLLQKGGGLSWLSPWTAPRRARGPRGHRGRTKQTLSPSSASTNWAAGASVQLQSWGGVTRGSAPPESPQEFWPTQCGSPTLDLEATRSLIALSPDLWGRSPGPLHFWMKLAGSCSHTTSPSLSLRGTGGCGPRGCVSEPGWRRMGAQSLLPPRRGRSHCRLHGCGSRTQR